MDVIPTDSDFCLIGLLWHCSATRLEEEKFQSDRKTVKEQLIPD